MSQVKPETTEDEVRSDVARAVHDEQRKLLAEMRRRTTMDDQEILLLLQPFCEVAFNAGYKSGFSEAEWLAFRKVSTAQMFAFCVSAAAVASWIIIFLRFP